MKGRPRRDATSPRSVYWTLYRPEKVREMINGKAWDRDVLISLEETHRILEITGFVKAVRIRENLIREKTRLLAERHRVEKRRVSLERRLKATKRVSHELARRLVMIRNILRIPREQPLPGLTQEEREFVPSRPPKDTETLKVKGKWSDDGEDLEDHEDDPGSHCYCGKGF